MALVIRNAHVWGHGDASSSSARSVLVGDDGRIAAVLEEPVDASYPAGAQVLDATGLCVFPGLIDMHAHLIFGDESDRLEHDTARRVARQVIRGVSNGRTALAGGITTVRDVGAASHAIFSLRRAMADGHVPGPTVIASGCALTTTGGHACCLIGYEADGVDGFRRGVREQLKAGADWIKVMATGGVSSPSHDKFDGAELNDIELRTVVDEAHHRGKRVAAHVIGDRAAMLCVEMGVDTIEHGLGISEKTLDAMAAAGTVLCPTVEVYRRIAEDVGAYPEYMAARARKTLPQHFDMVRKAHERGVAIVAGTDGGTYGWPVGDMAAELECLVKCGLSDSEALTCATGAAAQVLGHGDSLGAVVPGYVADLVLAPNSDRFNVSSLRDIKAVIKQGKRVA